MKAKILLIDDDRDMCEELSEILESSGYYVRAAYDGLAGKALSDEQKFDIIFLDLRMPGISGLDVLKSLRAEKRDVKILVITGNPLVKVITEGDAMYEDDKEEVLTLADGIMHKPVDIEKVLTKLDELLQK